MRQRTASWAAVICAAATVASAGCTGGAQPQSAAEASGASPASETEPTLRIIEANGIKLRIAEMGKGPLVLLLHGFPESWYSWRHQLPALAKAGYRAVAPDLRGYGKSDKPQPRGPGKAEDVIEMMDHLKIEKAHIHGYSMGGGITLTLLAEHPDRFITASFGGSGIREADETLAAEAEAMDKKAEAFAGYNEAAVLQMLVEVLPKVAAELARPMTGIDKLTVISADGAGELPRQVSNNLVQTMELLKTTTGLDIESLIQKYASTTGAPGSGRTPSIASSARRKQLKTSSLKCSSSASPWPWKIAERRPSAAGVAVWADVSEW